MPDFEALGGMRAGRSPVRRDDDALAGGQSVVFDDPRRTEAVERRIEPGRVVDDLAVGRLHPGGRHDVLGESLRAFDPGRFFRGAEAWDACCSKGVGDPEYQRHLRPDHDELSAKLLGEAGDRRTRGGIHRHRLGDCRDAGIAGRAHHLGDRRIPKETVDEGMLPSAGADHEYAHGMQAYGSLGLSRNRPACNDGVMPLPVPKGAKQINRFIVPVARVAPVWAVVEHYGRKTGRTYHTPVAILGSKGVVRIALPYGKDVDWVQNICAAGEFTLTHFNRIHKFTGPLVVQDTTAKWAPIPARPVMKAMKVEFYLQATEA